MMTLNDALAYIHPWLGTWHPSDLRRIRSSWSTGSYCEDIPMPPATDELAMQVLRKLPTFYLVTCFRDEHEQWTARITSYNTAVWSAKADGPRGAIIIATATWLQSQEEKQKE